MVSLAVELRRHRPAFRQVPHIHEPAAGHQQDERPFVRPLRVRGKPYHVHVPARFILRAFRLAVQRIIPVSRFRRVKQAPETPADVAEKEMFIQQFLRRFVPGLFPAQVPVPDRVRSDLPDPRIGQQFSQCLFFFGHGGCLLHPESPRGRAPVFFLYFIMRNPD